jgi:hypothetical protein
LLLTAKIAGNASQPSAITENQVHHEEHEEHEEAFINVFITRRVLRVLLRRLPGRRCKLDDLLGPVKRIQGLWGMAGIALP